MKKHYTEEDLKAAFNAGREVFITKTLSNWDVNDYSDYKEIEAFSYSDFEDYRITI